MPSRPWRGAVLAVAVWLSSTTVAAQAPVTYRVSFPEPQHHYAAVEVVFDGVSAGPLDVRMSRSSPGRYAVHEFAKNVYDVTISDPGSRPLAYTRPDAHTWRVVDPPTTVRVTYRVFGDRIDGTYLAVDSTHAHLNMPATLMWAEGLESREARVTFVRPPGTTWNVATQLRPTNDPLRFTAANLQYLMDSPAEFGDFTLRTTTVSLGTARRSREDLRAGAVGTDSATIRLAVHHVGTDDEVDALLRDVTVLVEEAGAVFGEYPGFDSVGRYTFLADYLPDANGDGMEHRNSTVVTSGGTLRNAGQRVGMLGTIVHEFFHVWNVERIRPASLEPFDFTGANVSGALWLAEGFTSYYQTLLMQRAGFVTLADTLREIHRTIEGVATGPGRAWRSPVEMSRLAPFVDAASWIDRTDWGNLYISYYTWGAALGLALDLELRDRTDGRVTLDDYMRALWRVHGLPPAPAEGLVARPYSLADARDRLAEVSGDRTFADEFFGRFVEGRDVPDYRRLLARAGFVLRNRNEGRAWLGGVRLGRSGPGLRLLGPAPMGSPLYRAGLTEGDDIVAVEGRRLDSVSELDRIVRDRRPGSQLMVRYVRQGVTATTAVTLDEDPSLELRPARSVTPAQQAFRADWLESRR